MAELVHLYINKQVFVLLYDNIVVIDLQKKLLKILDKATQIGTKSLRFQKYDNSEI